MHGATIKKKNITAVVFSRHKIQKTKARWQGSRPFFRKFRFRS